MHARSINAAGQGGAGTLVRLLDLPRAVVSVAAALTQPFLVQLLSPFNKCVLFHKKTSARIVALSLDDGPSPLTEKLLDVLSRNDAHATFFLLGSRAAEEEKKQTGSSLRRIVSEEHELGNHTWADRSSFWTSRGDFKEDFERTHQVLAQVGPVSMFRPGGGWFRKRMLEAAREVQPSYRCVLGSLYPHDVRVPWPRFIIWYLTRFVRPGDIIVLHEGVGRDRVVQILEEALPTLRRRGYSITTVSQLLASGRTTE